MKKIYLLFTICLLTTTTHAQWTQKGADIDGEAAIDRSGSSVSMSSDGNTVAIGARFNDGTGTEAGHVRVYDCNGSAWTQRGTDIDGEAVGDEFGISVSLSSDGNTLAIGAFNNDGTGSNAGHVRIYDWSGSAWTQKGADIDGEAADDRSGSSVSMSSDGNTLAIGACYNDGTGTDAGHVRIYNWSGSAWTQKGADINGEAANDWSGNSVSMSSDGNTLAIGACGNDGTGTDAGHVRIYDWSGSAWTQKGADIDGEAANDWSGISVSMSSDGNTLAIGAYDNDGTGTDAGHVRIYDWSGSAWTQKGADIDGEAAVDRSGASVSMSSDGNTLAIGAYGNDGTGSNAGHVRIYNWSGSAWTQKGADIDGEAANDWSGSRKSVSMSSDGNTLAIGAFNNDGTGMLAGHVRVHSFQLLCTPSTSSFSISNCLTYTVPSGDETYTTVGNYTVLDTILNTEGCDSVMTINLTINTVDNGITNSSPTLMADDAGAAYQWLDCDNNFTPITGEINQSYTTTASGNYAVEVTKNNCTDTSDCESVTVVGLQENMVSNIHIYPNPTKGILAIEGAEGLIEIYDLYGRLVTSTQANTLDISQTAMGIYFVRIISKRGRMITQKIVKE